MIVTFIWIIGNTLYTNFQSFSIKAVADPTLVWGPDLFSRGGRWKRERGLETLAALRVLLECQYGGDCDIGGYKEGVDVAILSFHWLHVSKFHWL